VRACLDLAGSPHRFTVWNSLPDRTAAERRDRHGSGLNGMRERSELMGGTFRAGLDGAGWLVEVEFPMSERSDPHCSAGALLSMTGLPKLVSPKPPKPVVGES
jgi:hypothetical protein